MPSRAATITGRSSRHNGVFYNGWELGLDLPTYPQVLRENGIQTIGVGKFHLECHIRSAYNDVTKYGFDRAETTEDIRAGDWLDWVEAVYPEHAERARATVWPMPHLSSYGPCGRDLLAEVERARKSHPRRDVVPLTSTSIVPEEACQTRWVIDRAIAFLRDRDRTRPFFLKASFVDPHDPYDPPARFLEMIHEDRVPYPLDSADCALGAAVAKLRDIPFVARFAEMSPAQWRTLRRYYLASLAFIDEQVGRLLAWLRDDGLAEDTAVVFSADHGDMAGDFGFPSKGAWHFDACCRVPLIVRIPGGYRGVCNRMVSNLDIFPTITDLFGIEHDVPVEGCSLLSSAGLENRPDATFVESFGSYGRLDASCCARSVFAPNARLTLYGDGSGMLFDTDRDPFEQRNLFAVPGSQSLRVELERLMLELISRQDIPLPHRNRHPLGGH
jgi:arylsulfatase A-like enzyme